MSDSNEFVERAKRAFKSIRQPELMKSRILLNSPNKIPSRISISKSGSLFDEMLKLGHPLSEEWYSGGDHHLLEKIFASGCTPHGWDQVGSAYTAPPLSSAWLRAKARGYNVPDSFLGEKENSYGENEAWCAAQMLVRGHTGCFTRTRTGHSTIDAELWNWQEKVWLTGSFIIPNPKLPANAPYIADQLWIVLDDTKIRKVVLEIDGEQHLTPERQERDEKKDAVLESLGYEVYRVAGWWARIDPYRVICEFLDASEIFPNAKRFLKFGNARSLNEYHCSICDQAMCRWDEDWIQLTEDGSPAHRQCLFSE